MNEDNPAEVVEDFLERHMDVICTHLLYLGVQEMLRKSSRRSAMGLVFTIDSIPGMNCGDNGQPAGLCKKLETLQTLAIEHGICFVTAQQA